MADGYQQIPEEEQKKAKVFFDRAKTIADTGNYDYAIDMMFEGLKRDPDAIEAHQTLRDMSLKRKAGGGKSLGMFEAAKYKDTKDERESMLNRERLLAFDPGNTDHMLAVAQRAFNAGMYDTVMWMGPICFRAIQESGKPELKKYLALASLYKEIKEWEKAEEALQAAARLKPGDMDLQSAVKDIAAVKAMERGNYTRGASFRDSVKDVKKQDELMKQDMDIRSVEGMKVLIEAAEREYAAEPNAPGKLMKLVEVLVKTEDPDYEGRALELLEAAFKKSSNFSYRQKIGEINVRQMVRMERTLRDMAKANPADEQAKKDYLDFQKDRVSLELSEFKLLAEAYPTETKYKFEVAQRMFVLHQYDEAIPALQQARQDPKFRADASLLLGRAFFETQFLEEASETLDTLINDYQLKGDERSKEMYYWRGRTLEAREIFDQAIKSYSQVAQWDFNYRDVQVRIKALRARPK